MGLKKQKIEYKKDEVVITGDYVDRISFSIKDNDLKLFKGWINSYNKEVETGSNIKEFLRIGREVYDWLDDGQGWIKDALENYNDLFLLEFQIPKRRSIETQKMFIEVPWELLADESGFLAKDNETKYCPVRRIGKEYENETPSEYRLSTIFMAASPRGVKPELSYEKEESTILQFYSKENLEMELIVEESGNLGQLALLSDKVKPVDVVHISCHGDKDDNNSYLCLEDIDGELNKVMPVEFEGMYSNNKPKLLFISACETSKAVDNIETVTYTQNLVNLGFSSVIGWSGSVSDYEATRFSEKLYRELSQSATIEKSMTLARLSLFIPPKDISEEKKKNYISYDWHLARLYLSGNGGGILSIGKKIRRIEGFETGTKAFLGDRDKGLEVASRKEFVGRRREIQKILNIFRNDESSGVLIHGIGNQGKSSLAARIANRMVDNEIVLIFGKKNDIRKYNSYNVLNEFLKIRTNSEKADTYIKNSLKEIEKNESSLKNILRYLLCNEYSGVDNNHKPILLVIDDLEKILDEPSNSNELYKVKNDYKEMLISVVKAFDESITKSKLIITSRYDFDLFDNTKNNISKVLYKLPLKSLNEIESIKQYYAKYDDSIVENKGIKINFQKLSDVCKGNPGLQNIMFGLFKNEPKTYKIILEEMNNYLKSTKLPSNQEVQTFLEDLAINNIFSLVNEGEKSICEVFTLFSLPIPEKVILNLVDLVGIKNNEMWKKRLLGLGLIEQYEDIVNYRNKAFMINNFARPYIKNLEIKNNEISDTVTKVLFEEWFNNGDDIPWFCAAELIKFALESKNINVIKKCSIPAIRGYLSEYEIDKAKIYLEKILIIFKDTNQELGYDINMLAARLYKEEGVYKKAEDFCIKALKISEKSLGLEHPSTATTYNNLSSLYFNQKMYKEASYYLNKALEIIEKVFGTDHPTTKTMKDNLKILKEYM